MDPVYPSAVKAERELTEAERLRIDLLEKRERLLAIQGRLTSQYEGLVEARRDVDESLAVIANALEALERPAIVSSTPIDVARHFPYRQEGGR